MESGKRAVEGGHVYNFELPPRGASSGNYCGGFSGRAIVPKFSWQIPPCV